MSVFYNHAARTDSKITAHFVLLSRRERRFVFVRIARGSTRTCPILHVPLPSEQVAGASFTGGVAKCTTLAVAKIKQRHVLRSN